MQQRVPVRPLCNQSWMQRRQVSLQQVLKGDPRVVDGEVARTVVTREGGQRCFEPSLGRLPQYFPVFERALLTFEDLRRAGAASLDLSWTAAGVLDGYFEQALGTWDVAAGGLLVREAGGVVTDWQGDDRAWLQSGDIVAAPAPVHDRILEVISGRV